MASELQSKNVELGSVRKGIKKVSRIVSPYNLGQFKMVLNFPFCRSLGPTLLKMPKTVYATDILTR